MFLQSSKFYIHWNLHLTMISRYCRHHLGMALCGVKACVVRCAHMACLEPQLEWRRVSRHGSVATELPEIPYAFDFELTFFQCVIRNLLLLTNIDNPMHSYNLQFREALPCETASLCKWQVKYYMYSQKGWWVPFFMENPRLCCGVK